MGGNALASVGATRCTRDVANRMLSDFEARFRVITASLDQPARMAPIKAYRTKPDFGDLDVLVESALFSQLPAPALVASLSASYGSDLPWLKNGSVVSIGLPLGVGGTCLQLDLIAAPAEEFDFSLQYFSWNDAGNLMGRVAHKMGLKFGHDGLWLPMRDGTNLFDELLVTRDFHTALNFLGFDAGRWEEGFDTIDEIYEFIAAGRRFHRDLYPLEHRNHSARVRDKKRPVYMGFLRWLEAHPEVPGFDWRSDKASYLPEILEAFPDLATAWQQSLERLDAARRFKERFNGSLVATVTGLEGRALGEFMRRFRLENPDLPARLGQLSDEQLREAIAQAHHLFSGMETPALLP